MEHFNLTGRMWETGAMQRVLTQQQQRLLTKGGCWARHQQVLAVCTAHTAHTNHGHCYTDHCRHIGHCYLSVASSQGALPHRPLRLNPSLLHATSQGALRHPPESQDLLGRGPRCFELLQGGVLVRGDGGGALRAQQLTAQQHAVGRVQVLGVGRGQ
jgi:hypothetical protein